MCQIPSVKSTILSLLDKGCVLFLLVLLIVSQTTALRCFSDSSDPNHPGIEDCLQVDGQGDGSRLCATTLIVYYEDKEIRLGIQRSCAAEDRDENIVDGACNTKTVSNSAGHEGMETMTCYCKGDKCNDRSFRRKQFRKWQVETEALFETRISSITWKLFEWVPEIFFYSVLLGAILIVLKFLTTLPQLSSCKKRRRKGNKKESIDESESEDKEEDDTTNVLSENDIRLRSKRINEDNSDS